MPDLFSPGRANDLWKTTCFELFLQPAESPGYLEFNFSPSTRWSAYAFDGHRQGRRDFPLTVEPIIEREPALEPDEANVIYALNAEVDLSDIPNVPHLMGVCAVIEETDGTISYWALAHPPGKPDFHDPACFALVLPAA